MNAFKRIAVLGTAIFVALPTLLGADSQTGFKTTRIAPEVIIPGKLGGEYYSRHSVISDELSGFDSQKFSLILNSSKVDKTRIVITQDDPPIPDRTRKLY